MKSPTNRVEKFLLKTCTRFLHVADGLVRCLRVAETDWAPKLKPAKCFRIFRERVLQSTVQRHLASPAGSGSIYKRDNKTRKYVDVSNFSFHFQWYRKKWDDCIVFFSCLSQFSIFQLQDRLKRYKHSNSSNVEHVTGGIFELFWPSSLAVIGFRVLSSEIAQNEDARQGKRRRFPRSCSC